MKPILSEADYERLLAMETSFLVPEKASRRLQVSATLIYKTGPMRIDRFGCCTRER
jgi:hypothetical protein